MGPAPLAYVPSSLIGGLLLFIGLSFLYEWLVEVRAVQVLSLKPGTESAYGVCNQRLEAVYHELLSTCAFNLNLRRYIEGLGNLPRSEYAVVALITATVRRCTLNSRLNS